MKYEAWRDRLINDVENAAAMCVERDLVDRGDPDNAAIAESLYRMAEKIRSLPKDDGRMVALWREESELANVPEREFGAAESRCHEAREDVLRAIAFEHGPYEELGEFFTVLRRKADETITEFRLA
jgi:hypothetical protein